MNGLQVQVLSPPNIAVYPPGATFGPRTLSDWEFVWLLEGDATYRFEIAGKIQEIAVPCGHLLLCPPGHRDFFVWDVSRRTRHGYFHFQLLECDSSWPPPKSWPLVRPFDDNDLFAPLARHLVGSSAGEGVTQRAQRNLAATLFLAAFLTGETQIGDVSASPTPEPVERALTFIFERLEDNPAASLSLESLATAAFVSPEHLCRLFKSATGRTPLETVRLARLDRAALLLARSNFSVSQVGELCGFASPFHFSRSFKNEYGVSPTALRASLEAGDTMPTTRLVRNLRRPISRPLEEEKQI